MPFPYTDIPNLSTWQSDSSVYFPVRSSDPVLQTIDNLVSAYNDSGNGESHPEILYYLRGSLVFWSKKVNVVPKNTAPDNTNPQNALPQTAKFSSNAEGNKAVGELLAIVTTKLTALHILSSPELLDETLFGIYGKANDDQNNDNKLLKRATQEGISYVYLEEDGLRRKYKLRFRGGIAWRWYSVKSAYALFDTTDNLESQSNDQMTHFIMDRRGRIYAGFDKDVRWFKHSSLIGGQATLAAGRLRAQDGKITQVQNDSGQHEPGHQQMRNLLERLHLYGADLSNTVIIRHHDKKRFSAAEVRGRRGAWPDGNTANW